MAELETVLTRRREEVEAKGASYTKAIVEVWDRLAPKEKTEVAPNKSHQLYKYIYYLFIMLYLTIHHPRMRL
jgi:hypothetical protein